jgi:hypothetical protein
MSEVALILSVVNLIGLALNSWAVKMHAVELEGLRRRASRKRVKRRVK